jgi:cytochrome c553
MKKLVKWVGIVVAALLLVAVISGSVLWTSAKSKIAATYSVTGLLENVPTDSLALARGEHLTHTHVCRDCHGESLQGKVFADVPPFRIVAPNLTSGKGGVAPRYQGVADWDRSIRYGIRPNGTALVVMPSKAFHRLSDSDAASLIAYLRSMPPVDNELPTREIKPLGMMLVGAGAIDAAAEVNTEPANVMAPPAGATAEYGKYIVATLCSYCHGDDLQGGPALDPETPPPPALAAASVWPLDQFATALRTGITPDGRQLNALMMPIISFSHFTDDEIAAIHLYLQDHFASSL